MKGTKIYRFLPPVVVVCIGVFVAHYFSGYRTSNTPRYWLADIQYTHLAITENLAKGNGTVLSPKTYNLDPDGGGNAQTFDGVCDARFPVFHYCISRFNLDFDQKIVAWRQVSKVFFVLSLLFTFLLLRQISKNNILSFIATFGVCINTSILFAQDSVGVYSINYALIIAAFYFYFLFLENNNQRNLVLALALCGIAALQGHGSILFFVTMFAYQQYRHQNSLQTVSKPILIWIVFGVIGCLFLYQRVYLIQISGGVFELKGIFYGGLKGVLKSNSMFLSNTSNLIANPFVSICVFFGILYFLYLRYVKKTHQNSLNKFVVFSLWILGSAFLYFICYIDSLNENYFYLLESCSPALALTGIMGIAYIHKYWEQNYNYLYISCLLLISLGAYSVCMTFEESLVETEDDKVQKSLDNLAGASRFLDSLGISKAEKISLINGYGANMCLMKTGRIGYVADGVEKEDIIRVLNHSDSKYILSQDQYFMFDVVSVYPEALSKLQLIATNETLSLYKKRSAQEKKSGDILLDYVSAHNKKEFLKLDQNFEDLNLLDTLGKWSIHGAILKDSGYYSKHCLQIPKEQEFPCTYTLPISKLKTKPKGVVITAMFYCSKDLRKVCFNASNHEPDTINPEMDTQYAMQDFKISKKLKGDLIGRWSRVSCKINFPENMKDNDFVKIYVWNPHKGELVMDNFSFIFY